MEYHNGSEESTDEHAFQHHQQQHSDTYRNNSDLPLKHGDR